jgi:hypothetical protein
MVPVQLTYIVVDIKTDIRQAGANADLDFLQWAIAQSCLIGFMFSLYVHSLIGCT